MKHIILLAFAILLSSPAWAQEMISAHNFSTGAMMLASSTEQGGQGPSGSTVLTQTEYNYRGGWWSVGLFYQYDMQGEVQTDIGSGPKVELHWNVFYMELGYLALMNRSYTDRSIAEETGDGLFMGLGIRFALSGPWFFQGVYKHRIQNIKEQDGVALDEPIKQTDTYPLAGLGYRF